MLLKISNSMQCQCDPNATSKSNKRKCELCFPVHRLHRMLYKKIRLAVKFIDSSSTSTLDYEGIFKCSRTTFESSYLKKITYWNEQYGEFMGMLTAENSQADHICPFSIVFRLPTVPLQIQASYMLCHFTNIQPMPAQFNRIKSNFWCHVDAVFWQDVIFQNPNFNEIYWPHCRSSSGHRQGLLYLNETGQK